jgi:CubicO group peptidase (beta-lactamase class C family)
MRPFLLLFLFPAILTAQSLKENLDSYMFNLTWQNKFKGNILIARNDTILYEESYGLIPNIPRGELSGQINHQGIYKKFWIGSLTKQFTAACILLLEQRGQLSTNDKLSKYFPKFQYADSITLHQMLCHRSGMYDFEDLALTGIRSSAKLLKKTARKDPRSKPGEQFYYNDTPYLLLSLIIEEVSGKSFGTFLHENIFAPFHMYNSGVMEDSDDTVSNAVEREPFSARRCVSVKGAGAIYSTIEDLLLWSDALLGDSLLTPGSKLKMFTPYTDANDCSWCQSYGYGIEIDTLPAAAQPSLRQAGMAGHLCYFHGGELVGMHSYIMLFPNENVKIIVLRADLGSVYFSWALAEIVFGRQVRIPSNYNFTLPDSTFNALNASYSLTRNNKITSFSIFAKRDKIYAQWSGGDAMEIKPGSAISFFYVNDDLQREIVLPRNTKLGEADLKYYVHGVEMREMWEVNPAD